MGPTGERVKAFTIWGAAGFLLVLPMLYIDWGTDSDHPQLERAVRAVRYLSAPRQIQRSSFLVVYPEGRPSDFVKWMFSPMGTAEWPPAEDSVDPVTLEQAKSIRMPVIPANTRIVPEKPSEEKLRQVVVQADDTRGMLMVEAYEDPGRPPVFTREWPLKISR